MTMRYRVGWDMAARVMVAIEVPAAGGRRHTPEKVELAWHARKAEPLLGVIVGEFRTEREPAQPNRGPWAAVLAVDHLKHLGDELASRRRAFVAPRADVLVLDVVTPLLELPYCQ